MLKKDSFTWSTDTQTAFETLKTIMTNAQVLSFPDFSKTLIVQIEATSTGLGVVLQQNGHPIAFLSKKFYNKLKTASRYVRELHAIKMETQSFSTAVQKERQSFSTAVQKGRHYLVGHKFTIETDKKA